MDFIRSDKNAQWLLPVGLGVFSCACSCAVMFCLWTAMVAPTDARGMSPSQSFEYGFQVGQNASVGQQIFALAMLCLPLFLLVAVGVVTFFVVRSYQQRNAPSVSAPPDSPMV